MPSTPATTGHAQRPLLERLLIRRWEYRHPQAWLAFRMLAGAWNVILGILLLAYKFYWIALVPLAGAALIFWVAYYVQQHAADRVRELERSRDQVVDDEAARLRRIERDLHDGPQAQMVAVAMKLGLAREKLTGAVTGATPATGAAADVQRALELVEAAHRGAKEAITELRELARGIHPSVLDQGLGTALATLAARSSVPVELVTDLSGRPSAAIETIAYFCAAELLTNVAKHSGAHRATLAVTDGAGRLRIRVGDDGSGGARVEAPGGLAGLAERIRAVDGTLQVSSPPGGPTVVTVELPSRA
jgi:signal transduction histidine kinase